LPIVESGLTALLPAVGIVVGGAIAFVRKQFKNRRQMLTSLMDRLTLHVTGTAKKLVP